MQNLAPVCLALCGQVGPQTWAHTTFREKTVHAEGDGREGPVENALTEDVAQLSLPSCLQLKA